MTNILLLVFIAAMLFWGKRRMDRIKQQAKENLKEGQEYLKKNAEQEGVFSTDSGLQYQILQQVEDNNNKPSATDRVRVHYHGTLIDGTVFDSSVERGSPISFGLNQVIPGWTEGLQLMSIGEKYRLFIPSNLGYGTQSAGSIPRCSVLIFEVELLGINE
ncbi:FKBP-type peptidyl-prolyl cis-trans isomerase [Endozoicomonadaceae bacterium StTr2]